MKDSESLDAVPIPTDGNMSQPANTRPVHILIGFFLGALSGAAILLAALFFLTNGALVQWMRGAPPTTALSADAIRQAARAGAEEAISAAVAGSARTADQTATDVAPPQQVDIALRSNMFIGKADAPITMIEFSDYGCGFCLKYHTDTYPRIVNEYVKTGKVKIAYKHFITVGGPPAVVAGQATECAADQNRFADFHEQLFLRRAIGAADFSKEGLIKLAAELKLDVPTFTNCLKNDTTLARVQGDTQEAQKVGGRGTPTFFVNGKMIVGAQPYEVFKAAIDEALKKG